MAASLAQKYDYLINEIADPRVKDWTSFSSPVLTLTIIGIYLFSIYHLLPAYMQTRKPYVLKGLLYYYNIFQIVSCLFLLYGILTSGWLTTYSWGCQPTDYSDHPQAVRMLTFVYYAYVLKGIELVETVLFVLRKKYNQVTKLHVYHHCSTFLLAWIGVKYVAGGMATFPIMINCLIHVFMYTYYLLASLGEDWQRRMRRWKPRLTIFQMVQFCAMILHGLQSLHPECKVKKEVMMIYVSDIMVVFYMFWQFYQESYKTKQKTE